MSELIEKIKAAYERDQRRAGQGVRKAEDLPVRYEDITAEWLTDVLCRQTAGARVTVLHLDSADNGSSNRRKIRVEYNEAGAPLPRALFCKASHGLANRIVLGLSGAARSEVTFYNAIRPLLKIEAPQCYFARLDADSFNSIVVLRDLSQEGASFCTHETSMTRRRVESQISLLAELHGRAYQDPAIRAHLPRFSSWPEYFSNTLAFGMREGSEEGFRKAEEVIPARLYRRQREIWPATLQSVDRHRHLPHTLAHGDVHLKNWYIGASGAMGLGDWQCSHRGHWGRDFAYTITTALTVDDRRAWEKDLLRLYLDHMQAAGGPAVAFDEAWRHYRQQLMTALTWWTITLAPAPGMPDMQPRDITLAFIGRIATAMDDLESLDSFSND